MKAPGAAAPLRENLASALLSLAGWPAAAENGRLLDPTCGAGILLFEAAGMPLDAAPGMGRDRSGLEGWRGRVEVLWQRLRQEAQERRRSGRKQTLHIFGMDHSRAPTVRPGHSLALLAEIDRLSSIAAWISNERGSIRTADCALVQSQRGESWRLLRYLGFRTPHLALDTHNPPGSGWQTWQGSVRGRAPFRPPR